MQSASSSHLSTIMDSVFFLKKAYNLSRREASVAHHTDLIRQKLTHAIILIEDMHHADAEGIYSTPPSEPPLGYEVGAKHGISFVPVMQLGTAKSWQESEESVSSEWPPSESISISGYDLSEPKKAVQDPHQLPRKLSQPIQKPKWGSTPPVLTQARPAQHQSHTRPQETYCTCSSEAYGRMIECDECSEWFHFGCVSITKAPKTWICPKCQ